jgi:4'-phosphopantetheinyl transferase
MTTSTINWNTPNSDLQLVQHEVHVWCANLDSAAAGEEQLQQLLSPDECEKANLFHFQHHRSRYIVGRGLLRSILSQYLDTDPRSIEFNYSPQGKPSLKYQPTRGKLFFNLSHSHELALYAIAPDPLVGIDIEHIRSMHSIDDMARRFFFPDEYYKINAMDAGDKSRAFFNYWTCKEAYLKATGTGLAGLEEVEVLMNPPDEVSLQIVNGSGPAGQDWFVQQIQPNNGYSAALVLSGGQWQIDYFSYIR